MNIEEIRSLQVGDLIAYEEYEKFNPVYHIGEKKDDLGGEYSFDYGLVEEITPYEIKVFWFSGCEDDTFAIGPGAHWQNCKKVQ